VGDKKTLKKKEITLRAEAGSFLCCSFVFFTFRSIDSSDLFLCSFWAQIASLKNKKNKKTSTMGQLLQKYRKNYSQFFWPETSS